jgi:hypothetical protein
VLLKIKIDKNEIKELATTLIKRKEKKRKEKIINE